MTTAMADLAAALRPQRHPSSSGHLLEAEEDGLADIDVGLLHDGAPHRSLASLREARNSRLLVIATIASWSVLALTWLYLLFAGTASPSASTPVPVSPASLSESAPTSATLSISSTVSSVPLFPPLCAPRSGPRVLVASSDNREHDYPSLAAGKDYCDKAYMAYTSWSMLSHRLYCMRHGYDYYKADGATRPSLDAIHAAYGNSTRPLEDKPRVPWWAKTYTARRLLPTTDLLILLDNDAFFSRPELSLPHFLQHFAPSFLSDPQLVMIVSRELDTRYNDHVNSGVSIWKNSPLALRLLDRLWTGTHTPFNLSVRLEQLPASLRPHCEYWLRKGQSDFSSMTFDWAFDQRILNVHILCDPQFAPAVVVLPTTVLSGENASFVSHMHSGFPYDKRTGDNANGAINALLQLTIRDNFVRPETQSSREQAMARIYPDEVIVSSPAG